MLGPADGTIVNRDAPQSFVGFATQPSVRVQVEAFDGAAWLIAGSVLSNTAPFNYDGTDLFGWEINTSLPARSWRRGITGFATQVRARVGMSLENTATTFRPDWFSCLGANPALLDFIVRCRTPRSPSAFLYTSDYPASVDLEITDIRRAGGLDVSVRNGGRPGTVNQLVCSRPGAVASVDVTAPIDPLATQVVHVTALTASAGQIVTCSVVAANEDGTAEANTANNTRAQAVF